MSSLLKKLLMAAGSIMARLGGGEASEGGGVNVGFGSVHSAGGGAAIWTFPLTGKGAFNEGYGGNASKNGGANEGSGGCITETGGLGIGQGGHDNNIGGVGV